MNKLLFLAFLFLLPIGMQGQRGAKKFYKKYKKGSESSIKFTVPGFLIHMGGGIARDHIKDDDEAMLMMELTKYIKSVRLMVIEEPAKDITNEDFNQLVADIKQKSSYEDLLVVRDEETNVYMMVKERRKKIKGLLFLVRDGNEFVMVRMKTNLRYKDLRKFIRVIMQRDKIKLKPPKDPQKIIPRA